MKTIFSVALMTCLSTLALANSSFEDSVMVPNNMSGVGINNERPQYFVYRNGWIAGLKAGTVISKDGKLDSKSFLGRSSAGLSIQKLNLELLSKMFRDENLSSNAGQVLAKYLNEVKKNAAFLALTAAEKNLMAIASLSFLSTIADFSGYVPLTFNFESLVNSDLFKLDDIKKLSQNLSVISYGREDVNVYFNLKRGTIDILDNEKNKIIPSVPFYNLKTAERLTWETLNSFEGKSTEENTGETLDIQLDINYGHSDSSPRFGIDNVNVSLLTNSKSILLASGHTLLGRTFGEHTARNSFSLFGDERNAVHVKVGANMFGGKYQGKDFFELLHSNNVDLRRPDNYTPTVLFSDKASRTAIADSNDISKMLDDDMALWPEEKNGNNDLLEIAKTIKPVDLFVGDLLILANKNNGWVQSEKDVNDLKLFFFGAPCLKVTQQGFNAKYVCHVSLANRMYKRNGQKSTHGINENILKILETSEDGQFCLFYKSLVKDPEFKKEVGKVCP